MKTSAENSSELFPEYAKDIKINVANVLTPDGAPDLSQEQIDGIVLASAYATQVAETTRWAMSRVGNRMSAERVQAAKAAAAVMGMNNVYYRFLHLVEDPNYQAFPAKLRVSVIGNPGIDKAEFEFYALAVSVINGCGHCVASHAKKLTAGNLSKEAVQSAARIASVVRAVAQVHFIENTVS